MTCHYHHRRRMRPSDNEESDQDQPNPPNQQRNFGVFSSPLEMESFFNQQLDEMLKQFGFGQFGSPGFFGHVNPTPGQEQAVPPFSQERDDGEGSRDFMLKKEWDHNRDHDHRDKEINAPTQEDWNRLFPEQRQQKQRQDPFSFFSGSSFSSTTMTNPDGTIEQRKTIRNSDGSETAIVSKKHGDECHTVTTTTNPDGTQTIQESNACQELSEFNMTIRQMPDGPSTMFDKIFKF